MSMKTTSRAKWAALLVALSGVAIGAGGCADYYGPPPYGGGYYSAGVSYGSPYGYGYAGYPAYGYPGYPYYGPYGYGYGGVAVISSTRYSDRYHHWHHWRDNRPRNGTPRATAPAPRSGNTTTPRTRTEPQRQP